jgi:hypothetical protein
MALEGVHRIEDEGRRNNQSVDLKFSDQKRVNFGITSDGLCECTDIEGRLRSIVRVRDGH